MEFFEHEGFLRLIQIIVFLFGVLLSTTILMPRGILFYQKWKEEKKKRDLSSAITYFSGGVFILLYFLSIMIIDYTR